MPQAHSHKVLTMVCQGPGGQSVAARAADEGTAGREASGTVRPGRMDRAHLGWAPNDSGAGHFGGGGIVLNLAALSRRNSAPRPPTLDRNGTIKHDETLTPVQPGRPSPQAPRAMPTRDFDIDSLARYLHLSPQQVARLADRGKIPGRKVAGQWRFSRAEIHHWLEQRIGLGDEEELAQVEGVLRRADAADRPDAVVSIAELLPPQAVAVPLAARTRSSVVTSMVDLAAGTGWLWDAPKMVQAVLDREQLYPTAQENGVALMHPRRPMASILGHAFLCLGITPSGIPFGGGAGLTDVFFLICSVEDRGHLRALTRLSRVLGVAGLLEDLRASPDAETARARILQAEATLPG